MASPRGIDWQSAKREYVTSNISQRDLARKMGVNDTMLCRRAQKEGWKEERDVFRKTLERKTLQKVTEKVAEKESDKLAGTITILQGLTEQMTKMIADSEQFNKKIVQDATGELQTVTVNKYNTKEMKEVADTLKTLVDVTRNLYNIPALAQEQNSTVTVTFADGDMDKYGD